MTNGNDFDDFPTDAPVHPRKVDLGNVDDAMTAGVPAAKFEKIGDTVRGVILSCEMAQQRDMATGKPAFWDDGNPKTQVLIVLETADRNPEIDDDNGHRQLYCKRPGALLKAVVNALGKVKFSQSIGGTLAVRYSGDGEAPQKGWNKPKLYTAKFWPEAERSPLPPGYERAADTPQMDANAARELAMRDAWAKFKRQSPNEQADVIAGAWKSALHGYFPGKTKDQISTAEWKRFAADNFRPLADPFANETKPEFSEDELPI